MSCLFEVAGESVYGFRLFRSARSTPATSASWNGSSAGRRVGRWWRVTPWTSIRRCRHLRRRPAGCLREVQPSGAARAARFGDQAVARNPGAGRLTLASRRPATGPGEGLPRRRPVDARLAVKSVAVPIVIARLARPGWFVGVLTLTLGVAAGCEPAQRVGEERSPAPQPGSASPSAGGAVGSPPTEQFESTIAAIPPAMAAEMTGVSWRPGCPVALSDLRLVRLVLPPAGAAYLDRRNVRPGMIVSGDVVTQAFAAEGFRWGGDWTSAKDYQHFEVNP